MVNASFTENVTLNRSHFFTALITCSYEQRETYMKETTSMLKVINSDKLY